MLTLRDALFTAGLPPASLKLARFCYRLSGIEIPDDQLRDADGALLGDGVAIARAWSDEPYSLCIRLGETWRVAGTVPKHDEVLGLMREKFVSIPGAPSMRRDPRAAPKAEEIAAYYESLGMRVKF